MHESGGGDAPWWAALQQIPGVGAGTMLRLSRSFGSAQAAVHASTQDLIARGALSRDQAERLHEVRESLDSLRGRIAAWEAQGIALVSMEDASYPVGLHDLRSPPPLLYLRGELTPADARAVAIVGTRGPTAKGARMARRLARELAQRGFADVSGLARGIDTAGHRGALSAAGGRTLAVLGCGVSQIYPPENTMLAQRISKRGCVMAEVPPDTEVAGPLLLARDRLQAALSRAVIVVQAHRDCGSIVTARHAVRVRRLLYAVPWSEPPFSEGWDQLRAMGAEPLEADADLDALAVRIDARQSGREHKPLV